jgi:multicomponent Na+:H+ antiporter subunit G
MSPLEWLATAVLVAGGFFYLAGTVGLLRFPDALSRLHALTKADNVGLLLVCVGLGLLAGDPQTGALLLLIWLIALLAATVSAHLIARRALADDAAAQENGDGQS